MQKQQQPVGPHQEGQAPSMPYLWSPPAFFHPGSQAQMAAQEPFATASQDSFGAMVWYNPLSLRMPPAQHGHSYSQPSAEQLWGGPIVQRRQQYDCAEGRAGAATGLPAAHAHVYRLASPTWEGSKMLPLCGDKAHHEGGVEWSMGTEQRPSYTGAARGSRPGLLITLPYINVENQEEQGGGSLGLGRDPLLTECSFNSGHDRACDIHAETAPCTSAASSAARTPGPGAPFEDRERHPEDQRNSGGCSAHVVHRPEDQRDSDGGSAAGRGEGHTGMASVVSELRSTAGEALNQEVLQQLSEISFKLDVCSGSSGSYSSGGSYSLPAAGMWVSGR